VIFLDNAGGTHPKPEEVYAEADRALRDNPGVPWSGGRPAAEILDACRAEAAALLGVADPRRVILTPNATDGLNLAIKGILEPGDHVVSSTLEHSAVARPLTHLQMRGQISLTLVEPGPDGRIDPAVIEGSLRHRTRLVVLHHGCGALGTVQPIEEIARRLQRRPARLLIDAAHTAGQMPIDVDGCGIDLLAASGHKGLYGPPGTGFLIVGEGVRLRPFREGGTGGDEALAFMPQEVPWGLEAGTPNTAGAAGLLAGLRFVRSITVERLREHQTTLIKRFIGALGLDERFRLHAARGDVPRTGTVSLSMRGVAPTQVGRLLEEEHGIRVAAGLHDTPGAHKLFGTLPNGTVRVSVGWFNTEGEIDRAVAALRELSDAMVAEGGHPGRPAARAGFI
jgi:selenocysteine lyase/cysteine desulfurase